MKLRNTTLNDLRVLTVWVKDKNSCILWAGPFVKFPFTVESLIKDINYTDSNTFSLVSDEDHLLGLGQILKKDNNLHLARIIISPEHRGQGLGKNFCKYLIKEGIKRFGEKRFSLNVYKTNEKAISLYKNLGFIPINKPRDVSSKKDTIYMVLKPNKRLE